MLLILRIYTTLLKIISFRNFSVVVNQPTETFFDVMTFLSSCMVYSFIHIHIAFFTKVFWNVLVGTKFRCNSLLVEYIHFERINQGSHSHKIALKFPTEPMFLFSDNCATIHYAGDKGHFQYYASLSDYPYSTCYPVIAFKRPFQHFLHFRARIWYYIPNAP